MSKNNCYGCLYQDFHERNKARILTQSKEDFCDNCKNSNNRLQIPNSLKKQTAEYFAGKKPTISEIQRYMQVGSYTASFLYDCL
jgi:hypothetical protein